MYYRPKRAFNVNFKATTLSLILIALKNIRAFKRYNEISITFHFLQKAELPLLISSEIFLFNNKINNTHDFFICARISSESRRRIDTEINISTCEIPLLNFRDFHTERYRASSPWILKRACDDSPKSSTQRVWIFTVSIKREREANFITSFGQRRVLNPENRSYIIYEHLFTIKLLHKRRNQFIDHPD